MIVDETIQGIHVPEMDRDAWFIDTCPTCYGTSGQTNSSATCQRCKGEGFVLYANFTDEQRRKHADRISGL